MNSSNWHRANRHRVAPEFRKMRLRLQFISYICDPRIDRCSHYLHKDRAANRIRRAGAADRRSPDNGRCSPGTCQNPCRWHLRSGAHIRKCPGCCRRCTFRSCSRPRPSSCRTGTMRSVRLADPGIHSTGPPSPAHTFAPGTVPTRRRRVRCNRHIGSRARSCS